MKLEVLHSSLDKGESWERDGKRVLEIVQSSDTPEVYFGIFNKGQTEIIQDFFFTPEVATKIGNELIRLSNKTNKTKLKKSSK